MMLLACLVYLTVNVAIIGLAAWYHQARHTYRPPFVIAGRKRNGRRTVRLRSLGY